MNFGKHRIDPEKARGLNTDEFKALAKDEDYYWTGGRHCQTDQLIYFDIFSMAKNNVYTVFYNKERNEFLVFKAYQTTNPGNLACIFPMMADHDYFVSVINPMKVMEVRNYLENFPYPLILNMKNTPTREQLKYYTENSNPILCFFKLRPEKVEAVYKTPHKEILNDYFYVEPVVGLLSQYCFTSDYLSMVFGYQGWQYNLLFDRINKRVVMDGMNILSSFKYGFTVPMPIAAQGEYFYSVIPYNELELSVLSSSNQSNNFPGNKSYIQSIDERNPVLIKFKFKDPNHPIWNDYERMKSFLRDQQGTQVSDEK